jgi:hypothetical protein
MTQKPHSIFEIEYKSEHLDSSFEEMLANVPFQAHSETSHDAAEAIMPNAGTLRRRVLDLIGVAPAGLTDEQIQFVLSMNPSTQRPRRIELQRMGLIRDSGRTRATRSGRKAVVWEVTK